MTTIMRNRETAEALSVVFEKIDVFLQETHSEILRLEGKIFILSICYSELIHSEAIICLLHVKSIILGSALV